LNDASRLCQSRQQRLGDRGSKTESPCECVDRKRAVGACEAQGDVARRIANGLEQRFGNACRQCGSQRIAISSGILYRDEPVLARDLHRDDPSGSLEIGDRSRSIRHRGTRLDLSTSQIADPQQEIVDAIR